jgi:hypothetical protein
VIEQAFPQTLIASARIENATPVYTRLSTAAGDLAGLYDLGTVPEATWSEVALMRYFSYPMTEGRTFSKSFSAPLTRTIWGELHPWRLELDLACFDYGGIVPVANLATTAID